MGGRGAARPSSEKSGKDGPFGKGGKLDIDPVRAMLNSERKSLRESNL